MASFARFGAHVQFLGDTPLGPVYWWNDGQNPGGSRVRVIADSELLRAYVGLHQEAHLWIHEDLEHDIWRVLDVIEPSGDVGTDYVVMRRPDGVPMRSYVRELVPDAIAAPDQLQVLLETVPVLARDARTPRDRFIAELVRRRVDERSHHIMFDAADHRFYIEDLDPSPEDLRAWIAQSASPA
jgi:hypothetical protein